MQKRTNPLALSNDAAPANPRPREIKPEPIAPKPIPTEHVRAAEPVTVSQSNRGQEASPAVLKKPTVSEASSIRVEPTVTLPDEEYSVVQDAVSTTMTELAAQGEDCSASSPQDCIEDEVLFPTLQDFEMSARFRLRGHVSRRMTLIKLSRDVCRLAQLLHPGESLSNIVEAALLTRIFLENPEAFDAMAALIEEKGGRIQC